MKKKLFVLLMAVLTTGVVAAQDHIEFKWYGLYSVVDYSYAVNMNKQYGDVALSEITGVVGFQIRKETAVGLGITYAKHSTDGYTQLPLFIELRSHYTRSRLTPFTAVQIGYSFPMGMSNGGDESITINKGGVFFGLNGGARFAINPRFGFSLHVGYQMMLMNEVEFVYGGLLAERKPVLFHLLRAGVGINF
ncbi:MAG: hypothetical protein IJ620_03220 [Bacteroidales bacterium]|nr:hypothetical protein [Bacteroidales bacterium]